MLSNTLQTIVEAAVKAELIDAKRTHGENFASAHEGYGVLMEELHEAAGVLRDLDNTIRIPLMDGLHENDPEAMIDALSVIELDARKLACEAIQVAAVARKYSETLAAIKEEEAHA